MGFEEDRPPVFTSIHQSAYNQSIQQPIKWKQNETVWAWMSYKAWPALSHEPNDCPSTSGKSISSETRVAGTQGRPCVPQIGVCA